MLLKDGREINLIGPMLSANALKIIQERFRQLKGGHGLSALIADNGVL